MDNAKLAIDNATVSWLGIGLQAVAVVIAIWAATRTKYQSDNDAAITATQKSSLLLSAGFFVIATVLFFCFLVYVVASGLLFVGRSY